MLGDILQPTHLLFVLVIALVVLGPKRLPEVSRSLGKGIRDFKAAIGGEDDPPEPLPTPATAPHAPSAEAPVTPAPAEPTAKPAAEPQAEPVDHHPVA